MDTPRGSHPARQASLPLARAVAAWRSSIQLRVVATTGLLSLLAISLLGSTLLSQMSSALLELREEAAVDDTAAGVASARALLAGADEVDPATVGQLLTQVTQDLAGSGAGIGEYDVVLLGAEGAGSEVAASSRATRASGEVVPTSVPARLREQVLADPGVFLTYSPILFTDGSREPGIVVGGQVEVPGTGLFELYYLFPTTEQQETIAVLQRSVGLVGLALVVVLAVVAYLVARQVATPVRLAAATAEQLAAGDLQERMHVPQRLPHDEVGRLAVSFNHMAETLQLQISELEELSRLQQQFVSDVSHELRTPLTTVRMAADVLHEDSTSVDPAAPVDPTMQRTSELLQNELTRFETLLADLLEMSRFDAGAASLEPDDIDVRDVTRSVVTSMSGLAASRSCPLQLTMPEEPVQARVEARRIARVVRNLVANAIEHGEAQPIEVELASNQEAVAITVTDHGVGLKPGEASRVFSRFWRGDPSRARTMGGSGLGLSIALEDARLHDGWLQAWGMPGQGSVFRLTVPREPGGRLLTSPLPLEPVATGTRVRGTEPAAGSAVPGGEAEDAADDLPGARPPTPAPVEVPTDGSP